MTPFTRPRIFGISFLDDLIVSVIGVLGQAGVVVIMLPILIVAMIAAVTVGFLAFGALASLLVAIGAPDSVTGILGPVLVFLVPLGLTALISVRVYRRLPRKLKRVAFEDYDDEVEPGSDAVGAPSGTTPPAPSLAELDARLARRPPEDE